MLTRVRQRFENLSKNEQNPVAIVNKPSIQHF